MNLFTGESADAFFGGDVPPAVHGLLHQAMAAAPADRAALLWTAQAVAPTALPVYYALYKLHTAQREFDLAQRAAWRALHESALQAGLPTDWRLAPAPLPPDVAASVPGRFWLFTLKALAFILLRSGDATASRELLARLQLCAPDARVGDDVIASLLQAAPRGPNDAAG